jgi:hypothetical protein
MSLAVKSTGWPGSTRRSSRIATRLVRDTVVSVRRSGIPVQSPPAGWSNLCSKRSPVSQTTFSAHAPLAGVKRATATDKANSHLRGVRNPSGDGRFIAPCGGNPWQRRSSRPDTVPTGRVRPFDGLFQRQSRPFRGDIIGPSTSAITGRTSPRTIQRKLLASEAHRLARSPGSNSNCPRNPVFRKVIVTIPETGNPHAIIVAQFVTTN